MKSFSLVGGTQEGLHEQAGLRLAVCSALYNSEAASLSRCELCCPAWDLSCRLLAASPDWPETLPTFLLLQLFLTKYTPFMVFPADAPPEATLAAATKCPHQSAAQQRPHQRNPGGCSCLPYTAGR